MNTTQTLPAAQNDALEPPPPGGASELRLTTTSKAITPFAGLASFIGRRRHSGFYQAVAAAMPCRLPPAARFATAGYFHGLPRLSHPRASPTANGCALTPALHAGLGIGRSPANDAIRRFFGRFSQGGIGRCFRPLTRWLLALLTAPAEGFSLNMDQHHLQSRGLSGGRGQGP